MSGSRPVQTPAGLVNVEPITARGGRGTAAQVRIANIDTWSVMRTSFVLSLAIAVVITVAVFTLWLLFSITGVFDALGRTADDIAGSSANVRAWFSFPRVAGLTLVVGVVEVVLTTAALTLFASLYNIAAGWVGGVEATLSEQR
jgi:hypothetical protein